MNDVWKEYAYTPYYSCQLDMAGSVPYFEAMEEANVTPKPDRTYRGSVGKALRLTSSCSARQVSDHARNCTGGTAAFGCLIFLGRKKSDSYI